MGGRAAQCSRSGASWVLDELAEELRWEAVSLRCVVGCVTEVQGRLAVARGRLFGTNARLVFLLRCVVGCVADVRGCLCCWNALLVVLPRCAVGRLAEVGGWLCCPSASWIV